MKDQYIIFDLTDNRKGRWPLLQSRTRIVLHLETKQAWDRYSLFPFCGTARPIHLPYRPAPLSQNAHAHRLLLFLPLSALATVPAFAEEVGSGRHHPIEISQPGIWHL